MALHRALRGLLQDLRLVAGTPSGDLSARSPHIALIRSAQQCQCCAGHSIRHQSTEAAGPSAQADSISLQSQASPSARRGPSEPLGVQQGSAPGSYIPRLTAMPGKYTTGRSVSEYIPWVFSRHQTPLRHVARRVQFFKQALEQEQEFLARQGKHIDKFTPGDIIEVRMRVPEAGGAEYLFKGVCTERVNKSIRSTFKLLCVFSESGPVQQHLPLYMPDLLSVKVVGRIQKKYPPLEYLFSEAAGLQNLEADPQLLASGREGFVQREVQTKGKKGGAKGKGAAGKKK